MYHTVKKISNIFNDEEEILIDKESAEDIIYRLQSHIQDKTRIYGIYGDNIKIYDEGIQILISYIREYIKQGELL